MGGVEGVMGGLGVGEWEGEASLQLLGNCRETRHQRGTASAPMGPFEVGEPGGCAWTGGLPRVYMLGV